jgi:predicted transcriptional regulator
MLEGGLMVIGKLEEFILMASLRAGPEALPSQIYLRVCEGQPKAAFGAVYTTLTRLEKKKLLAETSRVDDAGKKRRAFTITGTGRSALQEALQATASIGGYPVPGGVHAAT